jgi:hypothetical protein
MAFQTLHRLQRLVGHLHYRLIRLSNCPFPLHLVAQAGVASKSLLTCGVAFALRRIQFKEASSKKR